MDYTNLKESISNLIAEETLDLSSQEFDSVIQRIRNHERVFIYGAGGWGISLQKLLETCSIGIHAFFDRKANEIEMENEIPVYNPDQYNATENDKKESLVIIAVRLEHQESIANCLREKGFVNCITINDIWHYGCWTNRKELFSILHEKENVLNCAEIWEDQKSLDIYYRQIECYLSRHYNVSNQIDSNQYFPDDIVFEKGYSNFIDCGAYNGDTISVLISNIGKITNLVAIEADAGNFKALTSYIAREKAILAENIHLYPCGVWSSTEMIRFNDTQGPSSYISDSGNTFIQCISLDDILPGFIPTYIKMDIEGAEIEAIKGASNIINEHKPELAISVYHKIEHLWNVPLLIKSLNNYKFYLRSYEHFNQETVLYAV
jgi:FkbM family methyltransferase